MKLFWGKKQQYYCNSAISLPEESRMVTLEKRQRNIFFSGDKSVTFQLLAPKSLSDGKIQVSKAIELGLRVLLYF